MSELSTDKELKLKQQIFLTFSKTIGWNVVRHESIFHSRSKQNPFNVIPEFQTECTTCAMCSYRAPDSLCLTKMLHLLQPSNTTLRKQTYWRLEKVLQITFSREYACACLCVCVHIAAEGGQGGLRCLDPLCQLSSIHFELVGKAWCALTI